MLKAQVGGGGGGHGVLSSMVCHSSEAGGLA